MSSIFTKIQKKDPLRIHKLVSALKVIPEFTPGVSDEYKKYAKLAPKYLATSLAPKTEDNYFLAFRRFREFFYKKFFCRSSFQGGRFGGLFHKTFLRNQRGSGSFTGQICN